jgi:hypothetical protein
MSKVIILSVAIGLILAALTINLAYDIAEAMVKQQVKPQIGNVISYEIRNVQPERL